MGENKTSDESSESLFPPVEVEFGSVIRISGDNPDNLSVVVNVHGPTGLDGAHIISDAEGEEKIGLPGTCNEKVQVVGLWPKDKVRRAIVAMNGYTEDTAPQEVLDKADSRIEEYSSKTPVMYTGSKVSFLEHLAQTEQE